MSSAMPDMRFLDPNQPQHGAAELLHVLETVYGVRGEIRHLRSERDQAVRVDVEAPGTPARIVLKISNREQAEDIVDLQTAALRHIESADPGLPVPRVIADLEGRDHRSVTFANGDRHAVHALSWQPGAPLAQSGRVPTSAARREIGAAIGRLDRALQGFFHPAAAHEHAWDFAACLRFRELTAVIADGADRLAVESVFERAADKVLPALPALRRQLLHHDANADNVLVAAGAAAAGVTGIIDFGDLTFGALAAEVAIACDGIAGAGETFDGNESFGDTLVAAMYEVAAGYDSAMPLEEADMEILYDLVCLRNAMAAVIAAARRQGFPERDLHPESPAHAIARLHALRAVGRDAFERGLRRACRFPVYCPRLPEDAAALDEEDRLIATRARRMGKHATHFYERPMHFERARGPWLYATDGHAYLDCYNNVPQVGHCHPHVTRAIARQAAALNTNTRYLYSVALEYADRLTAKLAPQLTACLFVNSGSEANDVAWQMARLVTGRQGAIVMEDAYHGVTDVMRRFSPGHPDVALPPFLKGLVVPDPYRGPWRAGEPDLAEKYAADADRAIAELDASGHGTAAFMIDSALCSSGVPSVPDGYLRAVETRVRAAGGLMICDEVQSGFGRMGQWWGHEHHGARADIVTMGKPVGNGHPLGVVVTTQEILNRFIDEVHLFSTFGGNTVACAAGNAVLDVIENEDLIENGRRVGAYLRDELRALASRHALIGDVRGHGMITGVEFVTDRGERTPARTETRRLLELMRRNRVLVGSEGRDANILKLRPCLAFEREHVDRFIAALDRSLAAL